MSFPDDYLIDLDFKETDPNQTETLQNDDANHVLQTHLENEMVQASARSNENVVIHDKHIFFISDTGEFPETGTGLPPVFWYVMGPDTVLIRRNDNIIVRFFNNIMGVPPNVYGRGTLPWSVYFPILICAILYFVGLFYVVSHFFLFK